MMKPSNTTRMSHRGIRTIQASNDISLRVPTGQIYGVTDASGVGKSALMRCVNLLERPTRDSTPVDDQKLTTLPESELIKARRQIGMIFQYFNLLSLYTIFGSAAPPLKLDNTPRDGIKHRVTGLLPLVGLGDKHDSYPPNFSGGQKQHTAVIHALASDPKVLLRDEAASALDLTTTRPILGLLKDINHRLGLTILLITHGVDAMKHICDRVAVISNNGLIRQDVADEVFSHPKTPLAQKLVQSAPYLNTPGDYQERLQAEPSTDYTPMLHLELTGQSVDVPLLSETARRLNVSNNIISTRMDYAGNVKFGIMLTEMHGTQQDTQAVIAWLQGYHVKAEVLGYVWVDDVVTDS